MILRYGKIVNYFQQDDLFSFYGGLIRYQMRVTAVILALSLCVY